MHITRTPLTTAAPYDLDAVKLHARVDGDHDDASLALMARAAAREIEAHCALALMTQIITVTKLEWGCVVPLPIGPLDVVALDDHPATEHPLSICKIESRQPSGSSEKHAPRGVRRAFARHLLGHLLGVDLGKSMG